MYAHSKLIVSVIFLVLLFSCKNEKSGAGAVPAVDPATGAPVQLPNPWINATCTLITDEDVQDLFGIDAKAAVLNTQSLPDKAFCLRRWKKPDWKERETTNERTGGPYREPENRLVLQVINYHTEEHAKGQFEFLKTQRRDEYEEEVSDLGDGALWSTSTTTLIFRKGHLLVSIQLEHLDTPHDNLAKAKEIAALALEKMD